MRDPKTEQFLRDGGYAFTFLADLPLTSIVIDRANPARTNRRLDDDRILDYGVRMEAGTDFTAIILLDLPEKGRYELVSGLHRIEGAKIARRKALDAYLVAEALPYRRELLMRSSNSIEGMGSSRHEKLIHAREMLRYPDAKVDDIAKTFALRPAMIHQARRLALAEERADAVGVGDIFSKMPTTHQEKLQVIKNDNMFRDCISLADRRKLKISDVEAMVRDVNAAGTEAKGRLVLEAIDNEKALAERRSAAKYGRTPMTSLNNFRRFVRAIIRGPDVGRIGIENLDSLGKDQLVLMIEEAQTVLDRAKAIAVRMGAVA